MQSQILPMTLILVTKCIGCDGSTQTMAHDQIPAITLAMALIVANAVVGLNNFCLYSTNKSFRCRTQEKRNSSWDTASDDASLC